MKKVKFITPTEMMGASSRYRVYQYIEYLDKEINYEIYPFMSDDIYNMFKKGKNFSFILRVPNLVLKRIKVLFKCKKDDTVFIHRDIIPFGPMIFEKILKIKGCKIILDLDDAVYCNETSEISSKKNRILYKFKYGKRFNTSIKLADLVICGNRFIEEYVKKYNDNTIIIPTVIDTNKIESVKQVNLDEKLVIGWIGNPGNTTYVLNILSEINSVSKNNIKIILIGAKKFDNTVYENLDIEFYDWNLKDEYKLLKKCNIGIMPLNNSEWSKGKCGLKLLQYMAAGIPVIASDVGVNGDIVIEGYNGYLVNQKKSWSDIINYILDNNIDLKKMGDNSRKYVEENYSINAWKETFIETIKNI